MTITEAVAHLRQMLLDAGFKFDQPSPSLAWEVFKQFISVPVNSSGGRECEEAWFEACDGNAAEDSPGYFDFVRQFSHFEEDESVWHEQITLHFTCQPDARVGLPEAGYGIDLSQLPKTLAEVESSEAFKAGLDYSNWEFEVRIDSC